MTCATNAACAHGQLTGWYVAVAHKHEKPSATPPRNAARSWVVSLARAGTAGRDSVKEARGHSGSRQRHC